MFSGNRGYKPSIEPASDRLFIPLAVINDLKAQKNGTKKTVFWVKKKKKQEDGTVKGEKWSTSQQYSGDWKENKKHGYGTQEKTNIESFILAIGKIIKKKDMVYTFIKMEVVTMENGKIQKETVKV